MGTPYTRGYTVTDRQMQNTMQGNPVYAGVYLDEHPLNAAYPWEPHRAEEH